MKKLADAIAEVIYAFNAETNYQRNKTTRAEFAATAHAFIECSHPFDDGGDHVCPHCVGEYLSTAIKNEILTALK